MMNLRIGGSPALHAPRWFVFGAAAAICTAATGQIIPSTEEAVDRGLVYTMTAYPQTAGLDGFGCGFADLDSDGDPDVVLLGASNKRVGVFDNDGTGHFTDRSLNSGIPLLDQFSGFTAGDFDGDGLIDLYFTQSGLPNALMKNQGGFQFTNVTATAQVGDAGAGAGACFGDLDGDGRLDLYLCNYNGAVDGTEDIDNKLYRNLGGGVFEEIGVDQTVNDHGYGFQAVWTDYDLDGDVDLYLSNDRGHLDPFLPNQLWQNDSGQMVNVSTDSQAGIGLFSMGVACGDFDGNGWPDIYCTNIPGGGGFNNPLLLNQGTGVFAEESVAAGVSNPWASWGSIFYDFDNNGFPDLYVNNMFDPNALYLNFGFFPCLEVAAAANVAVPGPVSYASAVADVDDDGDLDLLLNDLASGVGINVRLLINHMGQQRNWIKYRMVGIGDNVFAVGGNVRTRTGSQWQIREILAGGNGYLGQNELTVHVGLDTAIATNEVVATWPGGAIARTLTGLPANETWTLYPPQRLGDADGDGTVRLSDYLVVAGCHGSGFGPGCEMMDFDGNSVLDLDDLDAFLTAYEDPVHDCNGNGQADLLEMLLDPGLDADGTGVLDSCEAQGDLDGDGTVGILDFLGLLAAWGPCPDPCPPACGGDLDDDCIVGVTDFLAMLANWG
jgi:hypothetical protein